MALYTTGAIFFLYRVNERLLKGLKQKSPPVEQDGSFKFHLALKTWRNRINN
ncbi:hypothetical protein SAMN04488505_103342 [Chitinophaga rupis]|uniref:Uncharacterized protein n=1 Tax=Chitinophaga rupis TaxID=573321 RepID=A0A1H7VJ97_9BACT|nr:hypothetical protein SAMN04488505_103342 [Chitinophaga rupis]